MRWWLPGSIGGVEGLVIFSVWFVRKQRHNVNERQGCVLVARSNRIFGCAMTVSNALTLGFKKIYESALAIERQELGLVAAQQ